MARSGPRSRNFDGRPAGDGSAAATLAAKELRFERLLDDGAPRPRDAVSLRVGAGAHDAMEPSANEVQRGAVIGGVPGGQGSCADERLVRGAAFCFAVVVGAMAPGEPAKGVHGREAWAEGV